MSDNPYCHAFWHRWAAVREDVKPKRAMRRCDALALIAMVGGFEVRR